MIFWGTTVGLAPSLLSVAFENAFQFREPDWLATLRVVFAFGIPLSLAYAVVKHRVLEIPVLLQRGARYLLVQRGFTIVLTLLSIAVTLAFASWLAPVLKPLVDVAQPSGITLGAVFGTVLMWGGSLVHRRVSERIDRAFFRRAYDARMILVELADRARGVTGRTELAALLHQKVATALQPTWLAVYFAEPGDRLTAMAGAVPPTLGHLSAASQQFADLVEHGGPVEASLRAVHETPGQDPLRPLDPDYLVPLVGRDRRLLGLLVLGARLSDEPYSGEDANLLSLVAGQAALALENLSLAEQIADRLEAERRQAHEIAIAQEVQQQLLPQRQPRAGDGRVRGPVHAGQVRRRRLLRLPRPGTGAPRVRAGRHLRKGHRRGAAHGEPAGHGPQPLRDGRGRSRGAAAVDQRDLPWTQPHRTVSRRCSSRSTTMRAAS